MDNIEINDVIVKPGTRVTISLPMPKLYDWTPLNMPIHVIRGKKPGPVLCLTAAIHGDEVNGVEIIRRLLKRVVKQKLSGTLIAIPIVNVYGFLYQDRYLLDRRDLNRVFPGLKSGSLASRLAHILSSQVLSQATHLIDLHTGSLHRSNLPQLRTNLEIPGIKALTDAFGVPVVLNARERDGSLRQAANDNDIPCLLYEAGEALRFDEPSIRVGIHGILNVMVELGMYTLKKPFLHHITPAYAHSSYWVRAPNSGILRPIKTLGKRVLKKSLLGIIANPTSGEEHKLYSPTEGIIIGISNLPLVHEGAALFHIASFEELEDAEQSVGQFHEGYEDYVGF